MDRHIKSNETYLMTVGRAGAYPIHWWGKVGASQDGQNNKNKKTEINDFKGKKSNY